MRGLRIGCVLGIALSLLAVDAGAGRKELVKAKIDGKRFRGNLQPAIVGSRDANLDTITITGLYQRIRPGKGTVKSLTIIAQVDLDAVTLPVTVPAFMTTYLDTTVVGFAPTEQKAWAGEGISVTVTAWDGSRLVGTFEGTIPATELSTTPAVVEKGKFKVDLDYGAQ
jgi:hypothetical protein